MLWIVENVTEVKKDGRYTACQTEIKSLRHLTYFHKTRRSGML